MLPVYHTSTKPLGSPATHLSDPRYSTTPALSPLNPPRLPPFSAGTANHLSFQIGGNSGRGAEQLTLGFCRGLQQLLFNLLYGSVSPDSYILHLHAPCPLTYRAEALPQQSQPGVGAMLFRFTDPTCSGHPVMLAHKATVSLDRWSYWC